jgi:hypothetical protein
MEHYLRTVLERSVVHAEYREASQVVVSDVLNGTHLLRLLPALKDRSSLWAFSCSPEHPRPSPLLEGSY